MRYQVKNDQEEIDTAAQISLENRVFKGILDARRRYFLYRIIGMNIIYLMLAAILLAPSLSTITDFSQGTSMLAIFALVLWTLLGVSAIRKYKKFIWREAQRNNYIVCKNSNLLPIS